MTNTKSRLIYNDKFQFVVMMIKSEGRQKTICQPSKFASKKQRKAKSVEKFTKIWYYIS